MEQPITQEEAYRALHLLPSAPAELVDVVYAQMQSAFRDCVNPQRWLDELDRAYTVVRAQPGAPVPASARSPWQLLHLNACAPPDVMELAYRFWKERLRDNNGHAAPCDGSATRDDVSTPVVAAQPIAYLLEAGDEDRAVAGIGGAPVRIGTDASCDVVVPAANGDGDRAEARIWLHRDRFMLHAVGAPGLVLVNEQPVGWAVLEHGDRLCVGGASFRFERAPGDDADSNSP